MLGFALGYAAGKGGHSDAAEGLAGIFIAVILILIVSLIGGAVYGVSQLCTFDTVEYESTIISTEANRSGNYATYYVVFENSLGEEEKVTVPYKEYKTYSEQIGEPITIKAKTHGVWVKKESMQTIEN